MYSAHKAGVVVLQLFRLTSLDCVITASFTVFSVLLTFQRSQNDVRDSALWICQDSKQSPKKGRECVTATSDVGY